MNSHWIANFENVEERSTQGKMWLFSEQKEETEEKFRPNLRDEKWQFFPFSLCFKFSQLEQTCTRKVVEVICIMIFMQKRGA